MNSVSMFVPCQIVYLPYQQQRLYAEVIQTLEATGKGWVRPLALAELEGDGSPVTIHDLRFTSDLLWPLDGFQIALDTEVLPVLESITHQEPVDVSVSRAHLHRFIAQLWATENSKNH
ncbi:hypothetical protein [Leptolyngbya sp. FACHB-261]|uniref:hypothetical protein n=1 Tax=Leptolyngbya sp. FACHB-261 TaxID=2692806 RepID=UPI001689D9AA|nr:hypothetical protein [Leptolyngbya sp. FACHB-261]MBD2104726.1 hypothetical protein [Leptolyngbya sp. FACHB-261]